LVFLIHTELQCTVNHTSDLQIMYWGVVVWLLSLLVCFSIDVEVWLEAQASRRIPKKKRLINKAQGAKYIKF